MAMELGADLAVNAKDFDSPDELIDQTFKENLPEVAFDCTGVEQSIETAILAPKPGGKAILIGMVPANVGSSLGRAMGRAVVKEVDIRGVFRYANCYPAAIDLIAKERIDLKSLISHIFPIEKTLDAFKKVASGDDVMKVLIQNK